jgi:hypothetical protein
MRGVAAIDVLSVWEQAYGLRLAAKGLALLQLSLPERPLEELRSMTVGQRDDALLGLRHLLFGPQIRSLVDCPECGEKTELDFRVEDVRTPPRSNDAANNRLSVSVTTEHGELSVRLPTCDDLVSVERIPESSKRVDELLRRCVVHPIGSDGAFALGPADVAAISSKLVECEPQADVLLALECCACEHRWSSRFDIVSFLWHEVDAWARRVLAEVHALGMAYGWHEREILSMSPWRRQVYLGILRQ